jgi:hypothetical protein
MRAGILILLLIIGTMANSSVRAADDSTATSVKPTAPQEAAKEPPPPPSVTVIGARDALGILGRDVRSAVNENMGRIVDVIVDREGKVRAAVIDFGGFGVGSERSWSTGTRRISPLPASATASRLTTKEVRRRGVQGRAGHRSRAAGRSPWDWDK